MSATTDPSLRGLVAEPRDGSAFDTVMAHLFRGEMHRMTAWRQRLDTTSNWAVVLALGLTTFALGSDRTPPYILLLGLAAVAMCMLIEARRYQHLHHSVWRLRLLESHYYVGVLSRHDADDAAWRAELAADLREPCFKIGTIASLRTRLRRNYLVLNLFLTAAWLTKVFIHPASPRSWQEFYERLAVGELIPSWQVASSAAVFLVGSVLLALSSPKQEILEGWGKAHRSVCRERQREGDRLDR